SSTFAFAALRIIALTGSRPIHRHFIKGAARGGVDGVPSRERLPTPNCYVHKARFDFHRIAAPTNALGGQHRGPGARKCVEHDVIAACAVLDRIGDHRDGFGGRMAFEVSQPLNAKAVGTWIMPNIRSRPAVTTKLNIV